jgi:multiple sugar transport system substrate-binding protein
MKKVLQIAKFFFLLLMVSTSFLAHSVDEVDLAAWNDAKVDWKKFQGTQLTVLADAQPAFVALKPYLPVFESLTGIKVGYITVEQSEMRKRREVDLISKGGVYDVVPIGVTFLGQAYKNNWLTPLEPYLNNTQLTDPDWYKFDDLSTNSLRLCTIEKTLLSVPFDFSAPVLFYRKDLFTKFNIQVPSTYQEMVTAKKQLQQAMDNAGMQGVYAFASRTRAGAGLNTWTVIPAIRSYGGSILDSNNRPVFNSPEAVQALETYRDMVTGYGNPPNSQLLHFYEIRQQFREGKLAAAFLASHFF